MISGRAEGQRRRVYLLEMTNTGGIAIVFPSLGCFVGPGWRVGRPELGFDAETSTVQDKMSPLPLGQGQGCS